MSDTAVIITHPHEEYDDGVIRKAVQVITDTDLDTYVVDSSRVESDPYACDEFDEVLEEQAFGQLDPEDAERLNDEHENILLGGGYVEMCAENTFDSLVNSGFDRDNIFVVPDLTYDQSLGDKYTIADVFETRDAEIISDYVESSNNELVERATIQGHVLGEVIDDIDEVTEMKVEEVTLDPNTSIDIGFEATAGEPSKPKIEDQR
ncbi:MAG: hypothetical protein BRC27_00755 [Nanohaloarchaea archaeon SW_10_44_10]|nr:MAG: hypothetical protein BRC27_00755 [Nanohaloarchaea archaeon SW_10_44_10]